MVHKNLSRYTAIKLIWLLFLFFYFSNSIACIKVSELKEASGIAAHQNKLYIVTDRNDGVYFTCSNFKSENNLIKINNNCLCAHNFSNINLASDLESIDILPNGDILFLSEDSRSLISTNGIEIIKYDEAFNEFGNKGLEGLAIRNGDEEDEILIASLWEGGYPNKNDLPLELKKLHKKALKPYIIVHQKSKNNNNYTQKNIITLNVPEPEGDVEPIAQRFRAPDLVWYKFNNGEWGFIVLLSSQNNTDKNKVYKYKYLQKFNFDGESVGAPIDIEKIASSFDLNNANWEGLDWYEEMKSLILIYDSTKSSKSNALIINL
jgi:hypothetical protein